MSKQKKAFISGVTGQDGSYLAEYLLDLGYEVHGLVRKVSGGNNLKNIDHIKDKLCLHTGSLASTEQLIGVFAQIKPTEVYNLAAQTHIATSYDMPIETMDINATGTLRMLEAARLACPEARIYQATTSEIFGLAPAPQGENTPFAPTSTYSVAKIAAYYQCIHHRNAFNMFVSQGILFNHTSPRRPDTFVCRKITKAAARIKLGLQDKLYLGNLDTGRDFGYSKDYVKAMHLILQHDKPDEFVIGTGVCTKLRDFLDIAFSEVGLNWEDYVEVDPQFIRPLDHHELRANYSKAEKVLGWKPETNIQQLIKIMVEHDLKSESLNS